MMNNKVSQFRKSKGVQGFSMVEVVFAVGVLAVGILGGMAMIVIGIGRNGANRLDTTATNVAQSVLEEIASAPPNANQVLTITDCQQNLQITTSPGGAALAADGDIDFSAVPVAGYQVNYVACGPTGLAAATYDVRWNVQQIQVGGKTWAKLVTVSAQQPLALVNGAMISVPPVTLRTVVGM